ncbi:MAG: inositol-3-phosphate synthase [Planctomycetes bacterium]|nr:inositol-3-phosphate synthase [Planctomycetota bacterium]
MNARSNDPSAARPGRTGVWLVGACGGVATLTVVGARAVARGLRPPVGLLTETPPFSALELPAVADLVFGGHEVRDTDWVRAADEYRRRAGVLDEGLLAALRDDLEAASAQLRPGFLVNPSPAVRALAAKGRTARARTPREVVAGIQADLRGFVERNRLDTVVVVNVSSTEPPRELPIEWATLERFERSLEGRTRAAWTASVLHAYAALDAGFPFVNFTPSPGSTIPALVELALARGVPHMGSDGKTGETLVKTVLAPLFTGRALRVLSWEGYNMLGNRDGLVLDDPRAKASKTKSKDAALRSLLRDGGAHTRVTIDYVPSLDDWKVAWDYVHFEGFLGAKMAMQFTWQGNDSVLAAPLVLDLARWAALARARGESGLMTHLAAYFKSPAGVDEHSFVRQLALLEAYAGRPRAGSSSRARTPGR